jgi:type II secretory pathway pseudopilin PulG
MQLPPQPDRRANPESGFVLIAVLFLVALILITLAVAAPKIAQSIQRDKELELVHRGEQYKRAIKLYYKKFGAYPSSVDQLVNTNQVRFLRKRYTDPMTGKDDWKIIYLGQAHVQSLGLFGQPLTNGTNPAAPGTTPGGTTPGSPTDPANGTASTGTDGSSSGSSSTFGSSSSGSAFGSSGSSFGSSSGSAFGSSGSSFSGGSSFGGQSSGTGIGGGYGTSGISGSGGIGGSSTGTGTTGTGLNGSSTSGSTLGGGPIVGVAIPNTKASIKEYKKQKHYNEWEFVYDPVADQLQAASLFGGSSQNLNGSGTGTGTTGTGSGFGSSGGSGFGSGSGYGSGGSSFGSSPMGGTPPSTTPSPTPQQ